MNNKHLPRVRSVEVVSDLRLRVSFTDGSDGVVDCSAFVRQGGVFAPLHDPAFFRQVRVNDDAGTIEWPNGADLCPDVLHSLATGLPPLMAATAERR